MLSDYPVLLQTVIASLSSTKQKDLDVQKMSCLTAVLFLVTPTGQILNKIYLIDVFPTTMNCVELVQLQLPNQKPVSDIPGFLT